MPRRCDVRSDAVAGLSGSLAAVPDGMAAGVLAGVSPVQGLYASMAGRICGGLGTSSQLMVITTTSAAALAAGSALETVEAADRAAAISLLTLVVGGVLVAAGLGRIGRYTRFVSHSVMSGFLTGIAVNILCSQVPDLVGAEGEGAFPLAEAFSVLWHPSRVSLPSLAIGLGGLLLLVVMSRTRWAVSGAVVAMVLPTLAVVLAAAGSVATVDDSGDVPSGLPFPELPQLDLLTPGLLSGAFAVAAITLVQGAGVSESVSRGEGDRPDADQDLIAQGAGNVAAGAFTGMPVGGSVSQTAVTVSAGGRTRWAGIWSGAWLVVAVVAFSGAVGKVAMPTLAAVLIVASVASVRPGELASILRTSQISRVALITTFLATLFLTVPAAVAVGVALSLLLQLNRDALDLTVVEMVPVEDGGWEERPAPVELPSHDVTVLTVYGSLFYAGARTLQARLPDVTGAESPVVVLRLRGRMSLGVTSFLVLAQYAQHLAAIGGRLYLSGLDRQVVNQMRRSGQLQLHGPVQLFEASERLGASTAEAYEAAETWLVNHESRPPTDD